MPIDARQQQAIDAIEAGESILLCGRAGTGKSFILHHWAGKTEKNHVLLAPTGVAAVHLGGQTIHSFLSIAPGALPHEVHAKASRLHKNKKAIIKAVETLVIDEISMVRADLLDCVDITLKSVMQNKLPFGGKQMVLVGDMYQLPPVMRPEEKPLFSGQSALGQGYAGPYFFHAHAFAGVFFPRLVNLVHSYRQQEDAPFLTLLNGIRNRRITNEQLACINARIDPQANQREPTAVYLTGTNHRATAINEQRLNALEDEERVFTASQWGEVDERNMPVEETLRLKTGARVMITRNDQPHLGRWVNGTTGTIAGFYTDTSKDGTTSSGVEVQKDEGGATVKIAPCSWEVYRYSLRNNRIERDLVGAFTQIPLRLAWALTIHKAQGKTFGQIIVDLANAAFSHGQVYVALSRCTHLRGIHLSCALEKRHILVDPAISSFMAEYQIRHARKEQDLETMQAIIRSAIDADKPLLIDYLRSSDQSVQLQVQPLELKKITHKGRSHPCLVAHEEAGRRPHHFNLARMLSAAQVEVAMPL